MDFSMRTNVGIPELLQTLYLVVSIRLSAYLHSQSAPMTRKWICTILGLINITVILNVNVWHFLLAIVFTIWLILVVGPKYCHIAGFISMFSYLISYRLIFYIQGIILGQVLTCIQSLGAMMVIGIGFEINMAYKRQQDYQKNKLWDPTEENLLELGFLDIFHYIFNFATICTGPYVRYQVYIDFIKLPFSRAIRRGRVSLLQITVISPLCLLLFASMTEIWPIQYAFTQEFIVKRGFLYQLHYGLLQWLRYRIFLYSNFGVTRSMSVEAGLGAYPVENKTVSAHGPTVNHNSLRKITFEEAKAMDLDMNTTKVIEGIKFETIPTMKEATREWNKCIQYWLGVYIYKSFPIKLGHMARMFLTLVISWLWHGVYPSMLMNCLLCAYYYTVESLFTDLQSRLTNKKAVKLMNVCFWISRQYFWGWIMMTYLLLDIENAVKYYKLTYCAPLAFVISMHAIYIFIVSKLIKNKIK